MDKNEDLYWGDKERIKRAEEIRRKNKKRDDEEMNFLRRTNKNKQNQEEKAKKREEQKIREDKYFEWCKKQKNIENKGGEIKNA